MSDDQVRDLKDVCITDKFQIIRLGQIISLWSDRGKHHPPFVNWLILNWLTENCNLCKMAGLCLHNKSSAIGNWYLVPRRFNVQIQFFISPSSHNPNNLAQQCPCWFWLQFCFSPPCQHCKPCSCRARDNLTPCHLVVCFVFAVVYCLWLVNLFDSAAIDPKSPSFLWHKLSTWHLVTWWSVFCFCRRLLFLLHFQFLSILIDWLSHLIICCLLNTVFIWIDLFTFPLSTNLTAIQPRPSKAED